MKTFNSILAEAVEGEEATQQTKMDEPTKRAIKRGKDILLVMNRIRTFERGDKPAKEMRNNKESDYEMALIAPFDYILDNEASQNTIVRGMVGQMRQRLPHVISSLYPSDMEQSAFGKVKKIVNMVINSSRNRMKTAGEDEKTKGVLQRMFMELIVFPTFELMLVRGEDKNTPPAHIKSLADVIIYTFINPNLNLDVRYKKLIRAEIDKNKDRIKNIEKPEVGQMIDAIKSAIINTERGEMRHNIISRAL